MSVENQTLITPSPVEGRWVDPPVSYVEPARRFCALCGRPISRRYFQAAPLGEPFNFCQPEHADLYLTYERPAGWPTGNDGTVNELPSS
jgi:hypothetical protein